MDLDIAQLRTLICVAETGSLSRAADVLCTAQPALSRHVRLAEEELGVRLFDRHGRGMLLTEQGRVVLDHAKRILALLDDMKSGVASDELSMRGHIAIGLTPTVAKVLAVPLVSAIRTAHPLCTCRVVTGFSYYLLDWVHRGEVDIAILYDPHGISSLKTEFLVEEELFAVAPGNDRLEAGRAISIEAFAKEKIVLPSRRHTLRNIVDRAAVKSGVLIECPVEADSYSMLRGFVMEGAGWTVLPTAAIEEDIKAGALTAAPFEQPLTRRLEVGYSPERRLSQLGNFTLATVSEIAASLVRSGKWANARLIR